MRRRTGRWVAVALAAGLVLSGCAGSDDESKGGGGGADFANGWVVEPDDGGEPGDGGTLNLVTYSEARSLDPTVTIANGSSGGTEMAAVYDLLVRQDSETGDLLADPRTAAVLEEALPSVMADPRSRTMGGMTLMRVLDHNADTVTEEQALAVNARLNATPNP